jgi:Ca-activated chloride channel family protein
MNAKRSIFTLMIAVLILSACAPAATQAPIATQPKNSNNGGQVYATRPPASQMPYAATAVPPMAVPPTAAPASIPPQAPYNPNNGNPGMPQSYPAPNSPDNTIQNYGINPFVDAQRDHLSTFAVDVDTASYTVARRYVEGGSLPPQEAVRVEEFVNYFDPGYNPPESAAFSIYADGAPSPFETDGTLLLRIGIQGYQVPDSQRKPAALTFVIDISGSMDMENRLGLVKQSLTKLVSRLRRDDTIGIVVFGTEARVVLEATPASRKGRIIDAIDSLSTEGSTNAEAGIRLGFDLAGRSYRSGGINRVIFCSDGVANVGNVSAESILEFVQGSISEGISLSTFGFGMGNFNDVLLEKLADKGNGLYGYIDNEDEAERLFIDNLTSTLQTIAQDAKVQVDFNSDVVARYRLLGYENRAVADQNFRNDSVDAGEIGAGHHVVAIYAVQLNRAASGRLATVQLRWKDPQSGQVTEINGNLNTWDVATDFNQADPHFQLAATVAEYAELLRGSPYTKTSMSEVAKCAAWLQQKLPDDSDVAEFAGLVQQAAGMWYGN